MENYNYNGGNYQPPDGYYDQNGQFHKQPQNSNNIWAAIVGFTLSIVNLCMCCCCTRIFAPISIVLCIIALVKKWRGTGLAVSGLVISAFTIVFMVVSNVFFGQISRDFSQLITEAPMYAEEYQRTGEIPSEYRKFTEEEYDKYWTMFGFDSFEEFYETMMKLYAYEKNDNEESYGEDALDDDDFYNDYDYDNDHDGIDDDFGEQLIDL